jgi:hypothetical protein
MLLSAVEGLKRATPVAFVATAGTSSIPVSLIGNRSFVAKTILIKPVDVTIKEANAADKARIDKVIIIVDIYYLPL